MKSITITTYLVLGLILGVKADAAQAGTGFDMPVRALSAGLALVGIKIMRGTSPTKLRAAARVTLGGALTVGGVLGAMYGQRAAMSMVESRGSAFVPLVKEFCDDVSTAAGMFQDLVYKMYYDQKRQCTDAMRDHSYYYYYVGKNKLNRQLIAHKYDI